MTITERNIKLKHFITCLKCDRECDDNCPTQYEAGHMGEIIENLEEISKALDQQPSKDCISRQAAIDDIKECAEAAHDNHEWDMEQGYLNAIECIEELPSAQSEWNNHTVACILAELFDDTCACNYNGIDEWLPSKCELLDSCPNPVGVACWEQYLMHRAERITDEQSD